MEIDTIVEDIMRKYYYSVDNMCFNMADIGDFSDYRCVKDKIVYRLVNYEKNKKLLKDVPHMKIMDLAIIYYCYYGMQDGKSGYVAVKNSNLKMWNITDEILHKDAVRNTPYLLESVLMGMGEVLGRIIGSYSECDSTGSDTEEIKELMNNFNDNLNNEMYVLTNKTMINGAGTMMYHGVLEGIAEKTGCDLYILPSSIHELILIPAKAEYDKDELKNMVCQVNQDEVAEDEILSDSVYYYSKSKKEIEMLL